MAVSQRERSLPFPFLILGLGIAAGVTGLTHPFGTGLPSQALALLGLFLTGAGIRLRRATNPDLAALRRGWSGPNAWLLGSGVALVAGWWLVSFVLLVAAFWMLGPAESRTGDGKHATPALLFRERLRALWAEHGGLLLGLGTLLLILRVSEELMGPGGAKDHRLELGFQGLLLTLIGVAWAGRADGLRALAPGSTSWLRRGGWLPLRLAVVGLLPFCAFLVLAYLIRLPQVEAFDVEFIHRFHHSGGRAVTQLMKTVSKSGGENLIVYWAPLIALYLAFTRRASSLRFFFMVNLSVFGIETIFKTLVHRLRPAFTHGQHFDSFPSGHTLSAVLLAGTLLLILLPHRRSPARWLLGTAAVTWPLLMAASRVYLGSHYLTDVIGSLFLGVTWVLWCLALLLLTAPKKDAAPLV